MILNCERVRVRFFKEIQDWILKYEGIRKRIIVSLLDRSIQDQSDHGASKEPKKYTLEVDSLVPVTHHLGLFCFAKKRNFF